jgi:hypothetical protein
MSGFAIWGRLAVVASVLLVLPGPAPAQAQEEAARAERRQRLQLQRAQAELEEAAAQRDALAAAKAAADGKARQLQAAAAAQARSVAAAQAEITRQQRVIEALQAALVQQVEAQKKLQEEAGTREAGLREQLSASRREAADRLQTVRSLSGLLERSTGALRQAESRNEALYREALGAVETYRKEAVSGDVSLTDPLGLRAVRRENTLDSLRGGLERQLTDPAKPPQSSR